jgi:transposase InsO family protein
MAQGMKRDTALRCCGITKNQFYHKPGGKKRGRKRTKTTFRKKEGLVEQVGNKAVVDFIVGHLKEPLNTEGYRRMTDALQLAGFYINHKKVYRLMKANQLLRAPKDRSGKKYVRYRILCPEGPLRLLEIDIKCVWVDGIGRYAYVLTIIDVFTRVVLYWKVDWHMKQKDVEQAWSSVIEEHLETAQMFGWQIDIEVRSDNGPQFSAKKLSAFLAENHLIQTFTHPYTPQENGHIESFHAILGGYLEGKYFQDMQVLENGLERFYVHYNEHRGHGSTLGLPPNLFWEQWGKGNITRTVLDGTRKVRFKLLVDKQDIGTGKPVGIMNPEGGLLPGLKNPNPVRSAIAL